MGSKFVHLMQRHRPLAVLTAASLGLGGVLATTTFGVGGASATAHAQSIAPQSANTTLKAAAVSDQSYQFSNADYNVNENIGEYPIEITRSDTRSASYICWSAKTIGAEAGENFVKPSGAAEEAHFAAGEQTTTVYLKIFDQGLNGPARYAQIYMTHCDDPQPGTLGTPQLLTLQQNDPLATKVASNPLGYAKAPTDGDPLQFVKWYIWGTQTVQGRAAIALKRSHPAEAAAAHLIAYTPGSMSYRYWFWGAPTNTLAKVVEMELANDQMAQPGTTMALSTYSLIHGTCQSPSAIKNSYEAWITQLARGIGNFRVVVYLEEDALMATGCLSRSELKVREAEIAYAVKALEADPHVVVYIDAGTSDAFNGPAEIAARLRASGIAQAQGFAVNATHFQWSTTEINWGQHIAALTGGKHFVVQTEANGRGPLLTKHPATQGVEVICNPPGRGMGPLTWKTGYKYVDGLLWFNNAGMSGGTCNGGPVTGYWPAYALGLMQRRVYKVTGPHFNLLRSKTDM